MTREDANTIATHMHANGDDAEVLEDYSGRGMYGKTTYGIVAGSIDEVLDAARSCGVLAADESFRSDNMGMDYIVY